MITEEMLQKRIELLMYFNEYVDGGTEPTILEHGFLLNNYYFFQLEEKMERTMQEALEKLGFLVDQKIGDRKPLALAMGIGLFF